MGNERNAGNADGNTEEPGCGGCLAAPFLLALRAFRPSRPDRVGDEAIAAAQVGRTVIGLAATAWLLFAYPMRESKGRFLNDKLVEVVYSAGVMCLVGPLALLAFTLAARPAVRPLYVARLLHPMLAFVTLAAVGGGWWFLIHHGLEDAVGASGMAGFALRMFAGPLLTLLAIPLFLFCALMCVHHTFRTADVHEVLPPLVSPVLVWTMTVFEVLDDAPVSAPLWIRLLFLAGPPLSVTALSYWELHRLRTRYGITLRGALGRAQGLA
ncbi:hypothetical protein GCM10010218_59380 [Streptomyces mashuensis]|uniref:RNA-directed RNA polymerase n=1 Tax=Streptomyces mashuensis TaxID=33904 RepID=A0A919B9R1_9ACTN|nr:hypothetical protein [Streptomyces mashuensis]GHF70165.1 hypothetical protein GCM10010218_59380 [Streptomyces mashuensis]